MDTRRVTQLEIWSNATHHHPPPDKSLCSEQTKVPSPPRADQDPEFHGVTDVSWRRTGFPRHVIANQSEQHDDDSLTTTQTSFWSRYSRGYEVDLDGMAIVAERSRPLSGLVILRQIDLTHSKVNVALLRKLPKECFITTLEIFDARGISYLVSEYMDITLVQVLAAPLFVTEEHLAAIVGQVCLMLRIGGCFVSLQLGDLRS